MQVPTIGRLNPTDICDQRARVARKPSCWQAPTIGRLDPNNARGICACRLNPNSESISLVPKSFFEF